MTSSKGAWPNKRLVTVLEAAGVWVGAPDGEGKVAGWEGGGGGGMVRRHRRGRGCQDD